MTVYKHGQEYELGTRQTNPASCQGRTCTWGLLTKDISEFMKGSLCHRSSKTSGLGCSELG